MLDTEELDGDELGSTILDEVGAIDMLELIGVSEG